VFFKNGTQDLNVDQYLKLGKNIRRSLKMPVEVRYHVIREGKEIAVYTSKKEADAHDKMLDIAEELAEYISQAKTINIKEDLLEELCIYLSKNRDYVVRLLKGIKQPQKILKTDPPVKKETELQKGKTSKTVRVVRSKKNQSKGSEPLIPNKKTPVLSSSKKGRNVFESKR
jgi:dsDNA-binding SOS-regulon protein